MRMDPPDYYDYPYDDPDESAAESDEDHENPNDEYESRLWDRLDRDLDREEGRLAW